MYSLENHPNFILSFVLLQFYLISKSMKCTLMLYFKLYLFTLLMQYHSFTFLFMYLGEPFQYYQSSNKLPQSAQTLGFSLLTNCLGFNLKSCFVFLNTSSRSAGCRLVSVLTFLLCFAVTPRVALLVVDLSRLSHIFLTLCCSTPRVTLLILDLSPSVRLNLCCFVLIAQHFHNTLTSSVALLTTTDEQLLLILCTRRQKRPLHAHMAYSTKRPRLGKESASEFV